MLEAFMEKAAEIIKAAAVSPLGIFALVILALAFLAYAFFRRATQGTRLGVFGTLTGAFVLLSFVAIYKTTVEEQGPSTFRFDTRILEDALAYEGDN